MKLEETINTNNINELDDSGHFDAVDLKRFSSAVGSHWMQHADKEQTERLVSANELTSLSALIAYVAHLLSDNEFRIERQIADRFNVPNVKCLPSTKFDEAIRFLVEQVPTEVETV